MDGSHHSVKGEKLVGSLMDDYKELLKILGEKGAISEVKFSQPNSPTKMETQVQAVLQRMQSSIQELRICYNLCLKDLQGVSPDLFEVPKSGEEDTSNSCNGVSQAEKAQLHEILKEKNRQLKTTIDNIRDLVWYADVQSFDAE